MVNVCKSEIFIFACELITLGCLYEFSDDELMKLLILRDLTIQLPPALKGISAKQVPCTSYILNPNV